MPAVRYEVMQLGGYRTPEGTVVPVIGATIAEGEATPSGSSADLYTNSGSETFAVMVRAIGQQIYLRRGTGTLNAASALPATPTAADARTWIPSGEYAIVNVGPGQKLAIVNANLT